MVHFSTDYVFDGSGTRPWLETDSGAPLSVYGQTKLEGEQALASSGARYLIFRTSWVFGHHGKNFIKTILRLASEQTELRIVADQRGAPTGSALLADATAHIAASYLRGGGGGEAFPLGLYHLTASGETSWHELARHVVQRALDSGKPLAATPAAILPIPSAEYATPAARPLNSLLETRKLRETFSLNLPDWRAGVDHMLDAILAPGR
jgi:dTDP-4-dehydrorhamnose reductase